MNNKLSADAITTLVVLIEESIRSTERGVRRFVEPAAGTFNKATSKTHSIVFGRRGSGKSSLLRKAASDLQMKSPIAFIDLEVFKDNSYPDVLLSILIQTFSKFEKWLQLSADNLPRQYSLGQRIYRMVIGRKRQDKKKITDVLQKFKEKREELTTLLHASDHINVQRKQKDGIVNSFESEMSGGIKSPAAKLNSKLKGKEDYSSEHETTETFQNDKVQFLNRHTHEYQELFQTMSAITNGDSYIFLDDLYYIRRSDQARVIDFFHRIAKNNNLWLKIGTVRHRSTWYVHGDPPYGLKPGDDVHDIDLDLTLEKYSSTKAFLVKVLDAFVKEAGINSIYDILVDDAIDRLVLASGGVTRDFLGIFNKSLSVAQERIDRGEFFRGSKIGKEAVNVAAGKYYTTKMEEFKTDIFNDEEHLSLEDIFKRIRSFCLYQAKSNIFLYEKDNETGLKILQELMDLRLIHKIDSHVTVSKRIGKLFEAYILDVSAYSEMRKKRGFEELMFWRKETNIRRVGFILEENVLLSKDPIDEESQTAYQETEPNDVGRPASNDQGPEQLSMFR